MTPSQPADSKIKLRLLFVSLNFAPELTATGKYTGEMAEWFARQGHEVDAIAGLPHYPEWKIREDYRNRAFSPEMLGGVRVLRTAHSMPNPGKVSALARIAMECSFTLASLYWWLRIIFGRRRYDIVIAVCPPMQDALLPWLYGVVRGVPWVYHVQDFQVDAALKLVMKKAGLAGRILYAIENFFLRKATAVSSITPAMCRRAVEKGASDEACWLVENWADIRSIAPTPADNSFRQGLGIGPEKLLVMYAGGMGAKQGLEVLVESARQLRDDPRFEFVMVGTGVVRDQLQVVAAGLQNLRFLDVQPLDVLPQMLAAADVHLIIQRRDAADLVMPSKLTNILAAGRPAIATAERGTALWDVLEGRQAGCCVEPENPQALCEALRQLVAQPERRGLMARNARQYAEENLDQDAILQRFEQRLRRLADTSADRP